MPPTGRRTLVLIATYNERENLARLLEAVFEHSDADVLLIDDSSPDGTGDLAAEVAATTPRLRVFRRHRKLGVASAHLLGFRYALLHGYDLVVEMDADFSHAPEDIPRLLNACDDADVVIGSRSVPGGGSVGRSPIRMVLNRLAGMYARTVLGLEVRDCTGGFRCSRRSALEALDLGRVSSHGYAFQLELNRAWSLAGVHVGEVPVTFRDRQRGRSKLNAHILLEAVLVVPRLRFRPVVPALRGAPGGAR